MESECIELKSLERKKDWKSEAEAVANRGGGASVRPCLPKRGWGVG